MSPLDHELAIDAAERALLEANTREDRQVACEAFLRAIVARNQERTAEQVAVLERTRGLA